MRETRPHLMLEEGGARPYPRIFTLPFSRQGNGNTVMWRMRQQRKAVGVNFPQDYNLIREFEAVTLRESR
jgi:hypothetical protein